MEEEAIDNALPVSNHPMSVAAAAAMTQEALIAADKDKVAPTGTFVSLSEEWLTASTTTAAMLKLELKLRLATQGGNKQQLMDRLRKTLSDGKPKYTEDEVEQIRELKKAAKKKSNRQDNTLKSFPPTAYWRELQPNAERVPEPINTITNSRAPTLQEHDNIDVIKHNFNETFDIPPFIGTKSVPKTAQNG